MAIPTQSDAQLNAYTYQKYLKYGMLNQGMLDTDMDYAFAQTKKLRHSGQLTDQKIKIGDNASAGPDAEQQFNLARLKSGTGETVAFQRKWVATHSWGFVSEKIDFQTMAGGAAYRELDEKLMENKRVMNRSILRDFWGKSTGLIGQATAVSGSTYTLPTEAMSYLKKDMQLWANTDETTATGQRWSSASNDSDGSLSLNTFTISGIDYRNNTITLSSALSHVGTSQTTASATNVFFFFPGGIGASRQKGVLSYVPSTIASNDSFQGVNRSKSPSVLAGYYKASSIKTSAGTGQLDYGEALWDELVDATDKVQRIVSGKQNVLDCILCNYISLGKLLKSDLFKENIRWTNNDQRSMPQMGFNDPVFRATRGNLIPIKLCNSLGDNEYVGMNFMDWDWSYLGEKEGDFISFATEGGRYVFLDEKDAFYKFRLRNYSNVMCKRPSNLFHLEITET